MGQFDNPKSIAMLFAGAFLCSLVVIVFLNAEVQSRTNYGSRIRNESLLEILGKKMSQTLTMLKEKNSHRRSLLYHLFISKNVERTPMRKLQYFTEGTVSVKEPMQLTLNKTHHRLRHEKKARRTSELRRQPPFITVEKPKKIAGGSNFFFDSTKNRTVGAYAKNTSEVISRQKLAEHEHCYTTNDVLEIIAVTCLVNFIFWFMIIFCVNIFTKNQMWKSQSSESLTSISTLSEDELSGQGSKGPQALNLRSAVDRYVDSLNAHAKREERSRVENEVLVPEKFSETGKGKKKTFRFINWRRDKLIRFSNNSFDRNSVTDSEENRKQKFSSQNKKQKNLNSFSMENLIF